MHPILFHIGPVIIPSYGAMAALGVLLALALVQRTAQSAGVNSTQVWNLCIIALFTAIVGSRLLLIVVNWTVLRSHPAWLLGLAMIHHPLLAGVAAAFAVTAAAVYMRAQHMPLGSTADALAAPLALFMALEQFGALLAGSGYGTWSTMPWAVTFTSSFAARWSGTPLGIPLHPVQAYAALAFLTISIFLLVCLPARRQAGDIAGLWLVASGVAIYFTEFWRDTRGRGVVLHGFLDGPQIAAIVLVLAGAFVLRQRKGEVPPAIAASVNASEDLHD